MQAPTQDASVQAARMAEQQVREGRARLMRLHYELTRAGLLVRVRRPRNGRWNLQVRCPGSRWKETVLGGGFDGIRFYATAHGRLLGRTEDLRRITQDLVWMVEGHYR